MAGSPGNAGKKEKVLETNPKQRATIKFTAGPANATLAEPHFWSRKL